MVQVEKLMRALDALTLSSIDAMACGDLDMARLIHAKIEELTALVRDASEPSRILFLPYDL